MTKQHVLATATLAGLLLLAPMGCVVYGHGEGGPPYAPAHGDRYHRDHDDVDLVWDAQLGVYAVLGLPSVYFWDGHYFRYYDRVWQRGPRPRGHWKVYRGYIPPRLARKYPGRHKKYKRGKGRW